MLKERFHLLKTATKCLHLLAKHECGYVITSVAVSLTLGALPTASIIIMQKIINSLQLGDTCFRDIIILIFLYISLDLISATISLLHTHYSTIANLRFSKKIELEMLKKATNLTLENYEDSELHNIISRARNEGLIKIWNCFTNIVSIIKQLVSLTCSITIISIYQPSLISIILVPVVFRYFVSLKFNKERFEIQRARTTRERKAWYITHLVFTGIAFKEITLFGLQKYLLQKYGNYREKSIAEDIKFSQKTNSVFWGFSLVDNIIGGVIFIYILSCGYNGNILIGNVISYTRCLFNIKSSVEAVFSIFDALAKDSLFVRQYFDFMELSERPNKVKTIGKINQITVSNLSFKYKNSSSYILQNISFNIKGGDKVLIVGLNGSGKTTLIKLLLGFYDEYEGDIFINGINLKEIDKISYYAQISGVFQDFIRYEASLRENVALSNVSQIENDDLISCSLALADFLELFKKNPDAMLGSWFDGAIQLSGGQWQKIALARAFFKDASLYLLDEPNSALDVSTENFVLDTFFKKLSSKIGICSSHRFSRMCFYVNKILVFDGGMIVEQGTHEELLKSKRLYYKMYQESHNYDMQ